MKEDLDIALEIANATTANQQLDIINNWGKELEIPCDAPEYRVNINDYVGIGIDFETGGLNCQENAITQIALIAYRLRDLAVVEKMSLMVYPYKVKKGKKSGLKKKDEVAEIDSVTEADIQKQYTSVALEYSDITLDQLYNEGVHVLEVACRSLAFISRNTLSTSRKSKPFFIGHNIQFDLGFWQQLMNVSDLTKAEKKILAGDTDFYGNFQAHYIDSIDIAKSKFANSEDVDKYKLEHIAEKMGFPMYDAHDALADTDACTNIYLSASNALRSGTGGGASDVIITQEKDRPNFNI